MLTSTNAFPASVARASMTTWFTRSVASLHVHPMTVNPVADTLRLTDSPQKEMPKPKRHEVPTASTAGSTPAAAEAACAAGAADRSDTWADRTRRHQQGACEAANNRARARAAPELSSLSGET